MNSDNRRAACPASAALSSIVAPLPAAIPFVAPEALERQARRPFTLRLGANESLFGPSPRVIETVKILAEQMALYGDPEAVELRDAVAETLGVARQNLVVGAGIDELLGLITQAYLDPGDAVVASYGSYPTFAYHVAGHGGRMVTTPYQDYRNDPVALAETARLSGAKLLYLSNPDNPTGSHLKPTELQRLLEALPSGCLLILDEAYFPFLPEEDQLPLDVADPRLLRLRTFSKAHGLAGMRVGYVFGVPEMVRPLDRIRNHFGVGRLSLAAALSALRDEDYTRSVVDAVAIGRADYAAIARSVGFVPLPSATNFVAMDTGDAERTKVVLQRLLDEEGVFIRMPGLSPLNRCLRVTIGPPAERDRFAEALRRVMERL